MTSMSLSNITNFIACLHAALKLATGLKLDYITVIYDIVSR